MIKFTPKQHQVSLKNKRSSKQHEPSELTMKFILGYAAAINLYNSSEIGQIKILIN